MEESEKKLIQELNKKYYYDCGYSEWDANSFLATCVPEKDENGENNYFISPTVRYDWKVHMFYWEDDKTSTKHYFNYADTVRAWSYARNISLYGHMVDYFFSTKVGDYWVDIDEKGVFKQKDSFLGIIQGKKEYFTRYELEVLMERYEKAIERDNK